MATSGSTDFNLVANEIIEKAFNILGVGSEGEAITARQYADGRKSLNLLVKAWGAKDHLWIRTAGSVTLVATQANYALATLFSVKPMRVLEVRRRVTSSSLDTPLDEMSQQEYLEQPNKTSSGPPNSFYYDPQRTTGTLYVWPTPDATIASTMTLQLTYFRRIEDFDASDNDADLPQEWLRALVWNLADDLEPEYPVNDLRLATKIENRAAKYLAQLEAFDNEPASLYLMPESRWC